MPGNVLVRTLPDGMVVKGNRQIVARSSSAAETAAPALAGGSSTKVMHQRTFRSSTVAVGGRDEVEVLGRARQIGQRNKLQETLARWD